MLFYAGDCFGYYCTMNQKSLDIDQLVNRVAQSLLDSGGRVATAESCTGGLIASSFVALAGSSNWFEEGFVTYSNAAKQRTLGVPSQLLAQFGAVSIEVVEAMAAGAAKTAGADYAVATSGIAGPGGGSDDKPVGTVCMAVYSAKGIESDVKRFTGDRTMVREQSTAHVIGMLLEQINQ